MDENPDPSGPDLRRGERIEVRCADGRPPSLSWIASGRPARHMSHQDRAQPLLVEGTFRVELHLPPDGFGAMLATILTWLHEDLAEGDLARHGGLTLDGDRVAIDFPRLADAARFLEAFPALGPVGGLTAPDHLPAQAPRRQAG